MPNILKEGIRMKKLYAIVLLCSVLLSSFVIQVNAKDDTTTPLGEEIINYYPKTKTLETQIVSYDNARSLTNLSSDAQISEPYTPPAKLVSVENDNAGTRSAIGDDTRTLVTNPSASPYCKIVYVRAYFDERTIRGTGVILGPDVILTAAHTIYRPEYGGYPNEVRIFTEVNGSQPLDSTHSGRTTDITKITIPTAYTDSPSSYYGNDWAILVVDSDVGYQQGWMGFGSAPTSYSEQYTISGYPEFYPDNSDNYTYYMYTASGTISLNSAGTMYTYQIDTSSGQSGAPIYSSAQIVYGVHVLGTNGGTYNQGTRITSTIYNLLVEAKNAGIEKWGS